MREPRLHLYYLSSKRELLETRPQGRPLVDKVSQWKLTGNIVVKT
jgi:hypothetical protein